MTLWRYAALVTVSVACLTACGHASYPNLATVGGRDCTQVTCAFPASIKAMVTRQQDPPRDQENSASGVTFVRVALSLTASRDFEATGGTVTIYPPDQPVPSYYALNYGGGFPAPRACSIPTPPSDHLGASGTQGPRPVLKHGHYGPISACFAVPAGASTPLTVNWDLYLVYCASCPGSPVASYQTTIRLPSA